MKPTAGSPPRPKKYGCHGQSLDTHGTWSASAWSATGLTVSGVEATIMTSMPSLVTRSPATVAARFESDCESLMMISMGCTRPSPPMTPSLTAAPHCSTSHWSVSPNAASGPVSGADEADLDGAAAAGVGGTAAVVFTVAAASGDDAAEAAHGAHGEAGHAGRLEEATTSDRRPDAFRRLAGLLFRTHTASLRGPATPAPPLGVASG